MVIAMVSGAAQTSKLELPVIVMVMVMVMVSGLVPVKDSWNLEKNFSTLGLNSRLATRLIWLQLSGCLHL
jgi:hypothetical protein